MPYSTDALEDIEEKYAFWQKREDDLTTAFFLHEYHTATAAIMAKHGLVRRFRTLRHCMDRTFQHVAPDETEPSREALSDASAYLQTFIVNVYGALDNLARIWIDESGLQSNGKSVPKGRIGLGPAFATVRGSLSKETQEYLAKADDWFKYLENYRHALAHRIPLYIPPRQLDDEAGSKWQALENELANAIRDHQLDLYDQLLAEQQKLGIFEPVMMHSFGDKPDDGTPVRFHGQMICDLATVVEIAELILNEVKSLTNGNSVEVCS
jgi:hypothetical protein